MILSQINGSMAHSKANIGIRIHNGLRFNSFRIVALLPKHKNAH